MSEDTPYPPDELPLEEPPSQPAAETEEDFRLLSAQDIEEALEALGDYSDEVDEREAESLPAPEDALSEALAQELEAPEAEESAPPSQAETQEGLATAVAASAPPPAMGHEERVRPPRARRFRRAVRNQIGMLPLALGLLVSGAYLLARAQHVQGLPNIPDAALAGGGVLVVGFTAFFHALLFGRKERGLIFLGVWVWVTVGALLLLVYGLESAPDATVWWPILLWSTALTFVLTYLVEYTHDARLLLLSMIALVAGTTAYMVTSGRISAETLDEAASYWPLLLTVIGVGVLPTAFRKRAE